jgi:hypothetical protein
MRWTGLMVLLAAVAMVFGACESKQPQQENGPGNADDAATAEETDEAMAAEEAPSKVLLAVTKSEFKNAVADEVQETLSELHDVERVATKEVDVTALGDYDVVVLLVPARGNIMAKEAKKVYDAMEGSRDRLVLTLTTKPTQKDWDKYKEKGIDAMTAASEMAQAPAVAEKIVAATTAALEAE